MNEIISPKCPQCGAEMPANSAAQVCPRCAAAFLKAAPTEASGGPSRAFTPPPVAELAPLFPQLEILELIGQGGMGAVYKARQKELDRIVALKILPPGIGDAAFAERFAREAKALARLNHPGIVTLYEFGRSNGLFFFLMEFVDGVTLRHVLQSGRISPREALAIVPEICDALQYAHDQGIVHRDIKPENILLNRRGRTKVADFGLAKLMESSGGSDPGAAEADTSSGLTHTSKIMGTPQYMAPEQVSDPATVDHRADIYALGVVFYQMLTGELPGQRIEAPSKKVQIDVRLDEVVLRALEKNPDLRYAQASALRTDVETISATPPLSPQPAPGSTQTDLFRPANWLLCISLLNFLIVTIFSDVGPAGWSGRSLGEKMHLYMLIFYGPLRPIGTMLALVAVLGAWRMRTHRDLTLGKVAAAICMVFPPGLFMGLPIGIWTLRCIAKPQVRAAFESRAEQSSGATGPGDPLASWAARTGMVITVCMTLVILVIACISPTSWGLANGSGFGTGFRILLAALLPLSCASALAPIGGWLAWDGMGRPATEAGTIRNAVIAGTVLPLILLVGTFFGTFAQFGPAPVTAFSGLHRAGAVLSILNCFGIMWLLAVLAEKHQALLFASNARLQQSLHWATPCLLAFYCALNAWSHSPPVAAEGPMKHVSATAARQGDIAVRLEALGTVESSTSVMFSISEDYCQEVIRKLDARQTLTVEADDRNGKRFGHGVLAGTDNRIDTATGTLKCTAILIPEFGNLMVPGLFLNVYLLLDVKHGVTLVPDSVVQNDPQSGLFVWVIQPDQTVARRPVKVGTDDGESVEIQRGLSPGEIVVSGGVNGLQEGRKVHFDLTPSHHAAKDLDWLKIQSLDGWIADLHNPDPKVQALAERALNEMGTNALAGILKILTESTASSIEADTRRYDTAQAASSIGPAVESGLPAFAALLKSGQQQKAYSGARLLAFSAPMAPAAFSILTNALTDAAAGVRDAASHGVALCLQMESNRFALPALPLLVSNLQDKVDYVRADTAVALMIFTQRQCQRNRPEPDFLIPPLLELLQDKYFRAREYAANALSCSCFGDKLKPWLPAIQKLLNDPDEGVRRSATNLLQMTHLHPATSPTGNPG